MEQGVLQQLKVAAVSGLIAGAATAAVLMLRGTREAGTALAPINATSPVAWGDEAAQADAADMKHTALGAGIHAASAVFWASIYEQLFGRHAARERFGVTLAGGALVAALAYVTDYHLVPKRLTPGWEQRLSGRSLAWTYGTLAASLPLRALIAASRRGA